jgi:hypothetical protein
MSSHVDEFLVARQVSEATREEALLAMSRLDEPDRQFVSELIFRRFTESVQAAEALKLVAKRKKAWLLAFGEDLYRELVADLAEIKDDLKWSKSNRGRMILYANEYAPLVYQQLREDKRFEDVYLGSHSEKLHMLVAGKVMSNADLEDLKKLLLTYPCQYPLHFKVEVK